MQNILDHEETKKNFKTYKHFQHEEHAHGLIELLEKHNVLYKIEKSEYIIDSAIVGSSSAPKIIFKILAEDFKRVNALIEAQIRKEGIPDNHYFHDFTSEELLDVLHKPDEWSPEDYVYAKMLLEQKGVQFNAEAIQQELAERLEKLRKGRPGSLSWIVFYTVLVMIGSFLFSPLFLLAGMGMGWYYWRGTNVDMEGHEHYIFDVETRKTGKFIFFIGLIMIPLVYIILEWIILG